MPWRWSAMVPLVAKRAEQEQGRIRTGERGGRDG